MAKKQKKKPETEINDTEYISPYRFFQSPEFIEAITYVNEYLRGELNLNMEKISKTISDTASLSFGEATRLVASNPELFDNTPLSQRLFISDVDKKLDLAKSELKKSPSINDETEVLREKIKFLEQELEKYKPNEKKISIEKVSKKGRKTYAIADKINALKTWDNINKNIQSITLEEFLKDRFGAEGDVLKVAVSTFHGWRAQLRKMEIDI